MGRIKTSSDFQFPCYQPLSLSDAASVLEFAVSPCISFMGWRWFLSLTLISQPLLASNFYSAVFTPLSSFIKLRRVRVLLWIRLWHKGLWLVYLIFYLDNYTILLVSKKVVLVSYHSYLHWSSTFNLFLAFTIWLFGSRGLDFSLSQHLACLTH